MKSILVATDFSEGANNAMRYALQIAQRTEAVVTALHVVYPTEGVDNNIYAAFSSENYMKQCLKRMRDWVKQFTKTPLPKPVEIKLVCKVGFPAGVICKTATDLHASLIVMGTMGTTGVLKALVLGSTAGVVLADAQNPVFVVPPHAVFRDSAHFVLATDFKIPVTNEAVQSMNEWLNIQNTGLDIVTVTETDTDISDSQQEKSFSQKMGTVAHDFHYVQGADVAQSVLSFLDTSGAGGLVTVARPQSWLSSWFGKSISKALARNTTVPMLVLHYA